MVKRAFDFLASGAGLILLSPVFLLVAVAIKVSSPGSVFFRQERLGRHNTRFRIFKFRTMVRDAESRGEKITATNDIRITSVGVILRRHKLDELPQLINVLRGEMSLVGPRPEVAEFARYYPEKFERILSVRPGITHQVTLFFRNEEKILAGSSDPRSLYINSVLPWKLSIYTEYLDQSFWQEIKTIFATVLQRHTPFQRLTPVFEVVQQPDHSALPVTPLAAAKVLRPAATSSPRPAAAAVLEPMWAEAAGDLDHQQTYGAVENATIVKFPAQTRRA